MKIEQICSPMKFVSIAFKKKSTETYHLHLKVNLTRFLYSELETILATFCSSSSFGSFSSQRSLFEIQNRGDREIFLLAQHASVFLAGLHLLSLLDEKFLVNQIPNLAETADEDVDDADKEDATDAHHNRFSGLLPIQERVNCVIKLSIRAVRQVINEREDRVTQTDARCAIQICKKSFSI